MPVIATVRGYVLGGCCERALACDLCAVGKCAKLGQPEVGLGNFMAGGETSRPRRLVGLGLARELVYTGRTPTPKRPSGSAWSTTSSMAQVVLFDSEDPLR